MPGKSKQSKGAVEVIEYRLSGNLKVVKKQSQSKLSNKMMNGNAVQMVKHEVQEPNHFNNFRYRQSSFGKKADKTSNQSKKQSKKNIGNPTSDEYVQQMYGFKPKLVGLKNDERLN